MKRSFLPIALCAFVYSGLSAIAATNLLAIYLVEEKASPEWTFGSMPRPERLKLLSSPLLADADFVGFDFTNQTFTITPEAAKRLEARIKNGPPTLLRGCFYELIPYPAVCVIKALDEPVYVGSFYPRFMSTYFPGPMILSDELFISTNLSYSVRLRIEHVDFLGMADPRRDNRIAAAVQKLFSSERK